MIGESSENNWYEVLGLTSSAGEEEIRRTYYTLVRRYPPRRFPADFQRITRAYHTLGDARRKAEYDQDRANGRRVRVLVDQAAIASEKDPQKAMMLLKNAVALAPDMPRPRALLAHVLMRIEEYAVAERQYRWLIRHTPGDELLRLRLARCLWKQERTAEAEAELQAVLKVNPSYHDAITMLSEIYGDLHKSVDQAAALEQAILNDGKVNYADFDALTSLLVLRLQQGDPDLAGRDANRLCSVVPPERAAEAVRRLAGRAADLKDEGELAVARALLEYASRISLSEEDAETSEAFAAQRQRLSRIAEARSLTTDSLIPGGLRATFQALYLDDSKDAIRKHQMQAAFDLVKREIEGEPRELLRRIDYLRAEYATLAGEQSEFLGQIRLRIEAQLAKVAAAAPPVEPPAPVEPPRRSGFFGRLLGSS